MGDKKEGERWKGKKEKRKKRRKKNKREKGREYEKKIAENYENKEIFKKICLLHWYLKFCIKK